MLKKKEIADIDKGKADLEKETELKVVKVELEEGKATLDKWKVTCKKHSLRQDIYHNWKSG